MLVIGLMSGTSLDGVDAALVEFNDGWSLRGFVSSPYTAERRELIHRAIIEGGARELCQLDVELGEWFAAAALEVCRISGVDPGEVRAIGSHGQTIWHAPPSAGERGATLQLGCAATIAERTGIDVVSDFRARDMAVGGQGAPLVPWVDRELFSAPDKYRLLLNIGGMANLTWLPPVGDEAPVLAFDTGPGNALIDAAVGIASAGVETFDRGGQRAAAGRVDTALLTELLGDPYLSQRPPKSTGRERFGRPFVEALISRTPPHSEGEWNDLIATLTAFTVRSISAAIEGWVLPLGVDEVIVTGGGAQNRTIMAGLGEALAPVPLLTGEVLGLDPDAKEAIAFAVLARAFLAGVPANLPEATGATGARVLGSFTPGRGRGEGEF